MPKANADLRRAIQRNALLMYRVAAKVGVHETTLCRWFREPLTPEQRGKVEQAIAELASEDRESEAAWERAQSARL